MLATQDDWRKETRSLLSKSRLYDVLFQRSRIEAPATEFLALVEKAVDYAYERTKLVARHMGEYTLHDGNHLFRVLHLMERLLPEESIQAMSTPELGLLILGAFFHDIGMAPSEDEVTLWLAYWDTDRKARSGFPSAYKFDLFVESRPDDLSKIEHLSRSGKHQQANLLKQYLVSEYIRHTHAIRAREVLANDWADKVRYRDTDLTCALADLCESHTHDPVKLLDLEKALLCGPGVQVRLPFLGVVLRLADLLDFDAKRAPAVLLSHLDVRHPVSLTEWQKHRSVEAWDIRSDRLAYRATCEHPAIEAGIHAFCDYIDRELAGCANVLRQIEQDASTPLPKSYRLHLAATVDRSQIGAKRNVIDRRPCYRYTESRFTLSHRQIIDLLMGTVLYGDPSAALRELVQNAFDACLARQALEQHCGKSYEPNVIVEFGTDADGDYLAVDDNGIGMDEHILERYYTKVGVSFYRSDEFYRLRTEYGISFQPISRFGIGVLACFMVADSFEIETRRIVAPYEYREPLRILVEGRDSLFWISDGTRSEPGTKTRLYLRSDHPWKKLIDEDRINVVRNLLPNPPFPIIIRGGSLESEHDGRAFRAPLEHLDHSNGDPDDFRLICIDLTRFGQGLAGFAKIWLLEESGNPVTRKEISSHYVSLPDRGYDGYLDSSLAVCLNEVQRTSDSLNVDGDDIGTSTGYSTARGSTGSLSVHGIQVPMELLSYGFGSRRNDKDLVFPFPCELAVDVNGERDIQLNIARTHVIYDAQWGEFCETLSCALALGVREQVASDYWSSLLPIWRDICAGRRATMGTEMFLRGLQRAQARP